MRWRLLGSHQLAVVLLAVLALAAVLGGTLPQSARLAPEELRGWQQDWDASSWLETLRLADVFGAPWFWGLCLLLLLNLTAGTLQLAWRRRQLSGLGLILGHVGLVLIVAGAMVSALSSSGAHLELTEGEVWDGAPAKLVADRGRPEGFDGVVRLDRVEVALAQGSYLRDLRLALSWQEQGEPPQQGEISANRPLGVAGYRVYPDNTFGHSAVLERSLPDGSRRLLLVHFPLPRADWGAEAWRAEQSRALNIGSETRHFQLVLEGEPARLEMKVSRGAELLYAGVLHPGDSVAVGGERLTLRQVSPWAGLYLARDRGAPWVFAGMLLAAAGFFLHLAGRRREA